MKIGFRILMLLLILFTASCGSKKKVASTKKKADYEQREPRKKVVLTENSKHGETPQAPITYADKIAAYIALYAPIAQEEMKLYKIPASITLAQGILESGAGEGTLTLKANNHFGIKCHDWKGESVFHDDDRSQECFRKYKDPKYSFRDHSLFLTERKRYAKLFELDPADYEGWAKGLRAAGYATDSRYPHKLIDLIERYELYKYDGEPTGRRVVAYNEGNTAARSEQYVVRQGDTLYSISKRYDLTVDQLKKMNNLSGTAISIGQILNVSR